jgi:hypothetical protein
MRARLKKIGGNHDDAGPAARATDVMQIAHESMSQDSSAQIAPLL